MNSNTDEYIEGFNDGYNFYEGERVFKYKNRSFKLQLIQCKLRRIAYENSKECLTKEEISELSNFLDKDMF